MDNRSEQIVHNNGTHAVLVPATKHEYDSSTTDPTLILIFGWMNARKTHLQKYAQEYAQLYPSSPQIVLTSDSRWYWKSQKAREITMLPVVQQVERAGAIPNQSTLDRDVRRPRVLLHVFSNGGAGSLVDLASLLAKSSGSIPGATSAIVFDSAPGGGTFLSANRSFTAGMRHPVTKYFAMYIVSCLYVFMLIYRMVARRPHPFKEMLLALNRPDLLPWTSKSTPRLYIYSSGDEIVEDRVVEEHAAKAKQAGLDVRMENFGRSAHVAHMRENPDRYWSAVRGLWADVVRRNQ